MPKHTIPLAGQSQDESHLDLSALAAADALREVETLAASVATALHIDNIPAITAALLQALPNVDMFALWSLVDSLRVKGNYS